MAAGICVRFFSIAAGAFLIAAACYGTPGSLVLLNGQTLKGEIEELPDGSCWLTRKGGAFKFEKDEIKHIVCSPGVKKNTSTDKFARSFQATPAITAPARAAATPYDELIHHSARVNDLDPALVKAVIKAESNFNPRDRSHKGACGLMQLMPGTARILGVRDIYSPSENIAAGTRFLRDMLNQFNGDPVRAVAAYNAGPGPVRRYNNVPPYRETKQYVRNVFRYYDRYRSSRLVSSSEDEAGRLTFTNVR